MAEGGNQSSTTTPVNLKVYWTPTHRHDHYEADYEEYGLTENIAHHDHDGGQQGDAENYLIPEQVVADENAQDKAVSVARVEKYQDRWRAIRFKCRHKWRMRIRVILG
jgi:hypothetical protein